MICDRCHEEKPDVQWIICYDGFMSYRKPGKSEVTDEKEVTNGKMCTVCWERRGEKTTETEYTSRAMPSKKILCIIVLIIVGFVMFWGMMELVNHVDPGMK